MTSAKKRAAVYVGTYEKYNSGSLKGAWLYLEDYDDQNDFLWACLELHKDEQDPELMFQDFENFPKQYYSECSIDEDLWKVFFEIDEDERAAYEAYCSNYGPGADYDSFQDAYQGKFDSELDFTYYLVGEMGIIGKGDSILERYFNYDAFNRDLFLSDYTFIDGYVFSDY